MVTTLNIDNLRMITNGDLALEAQLFAVFLESSQECLTKLHLALTNKDECSWKQAAHAFAGICLNMHAAEMSSLCLEAQKNYTASEEEKMRLLAAIEHEAFHVQKANSSYSGTGSRKTYALCLTTLSLVNRSECIVFNDIFIHGPLPSEAEKGAYIPLLVLASYIVASFASYAGLTLATKMFDAQCVRKKRLLHFMGAFALGSGIWSMHFIGMLAYKMRMDVHYDPMLTIVSLLIAIIVAYVALYVTRTNKLTLKILCLSSVFLGIGICAMHYIGMEAMLMRATLHYIPSLFILSVLIAIGASGAALWIISSLERHIGSFKQLWTICAALIMGVAICGMHYTGLAASVFIPFKDCQFNIDQDYTVLAVALILSTTVILFIVTFAISHRLSLLVSCALFFIMPPVVIIYETTKGLNSNIAEAQNEVSKLSYHARLFYLLEKIEELNNNNDVSRSGVAVIGQDVKPTTLDFSKAISAIDQDQSFKDDQNITHAWDEIKSKILFSQSPSNSTSQDNESSILLGSSVLNLMNKVIDQERTQSDTPTDQYYLANTVLKILPANIIIIGNIREMLVEQNNDMSVANDQVKKLQVSFDDVDYNNHYLENYIKSINTTDIDSISIHYHDSATITLTGYTEFFGQIISGYATHIPSGEIITLSNGVIDAYSDLYFRINNKSLDDLKQRLDKYNLKKDLLLFFSIIAFLGVNAIFLFLYNSLTKTEKTKKELLITQADLALRLEDKERMEERMKLYTDRLEEWRFQSIEINKNMEWETARTKTILDNVSEGIVTLNQNGSIQTFNKAAEKVFGYSADVIIGQKLNLLIPSVSRYHLINGAHYERLGTHKNGNLFPLILTINEILVDNSILLIGVIRDISEQKAKERELLVAKEQAETSNRTKSDFLANMSHELRTPLNSILGMLRLLKAQELNDESESLTEIAMRSSNHLLEIVNDILDLSKIESGEMRLEHIGIDLNYIMSSNILTLSHIAREKNLPLIWNNIKNQEKLPFVMGDPTRLILILNNLIGNAIKYTLDGQVEVTTSYEYLDSKNIEFRCEIKDTGIGIAKDKLSSVFDKFIQADTSTTRQFGGTGLGLAITKQLVELMGGSIGVNSEVGHGSTFWFNIAFKVTDKVNSESQNHKKKKRLDVLKPENVRILVAEDQPMNQILMTKVLQNFEIGYFEIVSNGIEALKKYRESSWDIILMDCHMPEKNGYDTTKDIRCLEKRTGKHTPIIALTANAMIGDKEECLRCGMDEYASKPINIDELKVTLGQWIVF